MNERIIDYLHGTLDADAQAQFEQQLREDAALRAEVARLRQLKNRLRGELNAEVASAEPPATMTFDAIVPRIQRRRVAWSQRISYTFAALAAVVVLLFAVVYSLPEDSRQPIEGGFETAIPEYTPFAVTPTVTMTPSTDSVNPSTIVTRTPESADENLLESTSPAAGNSIVTRTPVSTIER